MIAVRLMGGLGNQLFQYAFGRALGFLTDQEPYFFYIGRINTERPLSILRIVPSIKMLTDEEISRYYFFPKGGLLPRIERRLVGRMPFIGRDIHLEKSLAYYCVDKKKTCYDGYWQSFRYFDEYRSKILQDLKFSEKVSIPHSFESVIDKHQSVSLHIRRGDYLMYNRRSIHCSVGLEYYKEALRILGLRVDNPVLFVFSDDLIWAKKNLIIPPFFEVRYIEYNSEFNDITDLFLMSKCKHNIIANSTFSWWAAYLNSNKGLVIAPSRWYNKNLDFKIDDLIPQTWKKVHW